MGGAIGGGVGFKTAKWDWPSKLAAQVLSGSMGGGITAAIAGGNVWQGMATGAAGAAAAFAVTVAMSGDAPKKAVEVKEDHELRAAVDRGIAAAAETKINHANDLAMNFGDTVLDAGSNFFAGMGDKITFGRTNALRDAWGINGTVDKASGFYKTGEVAGVATRDALITAVGARGLSALGGTRLGHALNHNPYLRFGPGRMPARGGLPAGTDVPRIAIGRDPGAFHIDLRVRPFD